MNKYIPAYPHLLCGNKMCLWVCVSKWMEEACGESQTPQVLQVKAIHPQIIKGRYTLDLLVRIFTGMFVCLCDA